MYLSRGMSKRRKYIDMNKGKNSDNDFSELDWLVATYRSIISSTDISKSFEALKKFHERYYRQAN